MKHLVAPILSCIVLAVAIIGFAFVMLQIGTFGTTIAKAKESERIASLRDQALQSASAFLNDTASDRAELENFVVKNSNSVSFITAIEDAGLREKVIANIGSINLPSTEWKYHEPVQVVVTARGSFAALSQFATALESLPVGSRLLTMSIEASANHTWFGTFTLDFVKEKSSTSMSSRTSSL